MSDDACKTCKADSCRCETDAINTRRRELGLEEISNGDTIGLALSGGGIRSAVFCLGLVRALAKNKLWKKIDYISTVSGGGYLGGMLGRLYTSQVQGARVEKALASDDTILLAWLRNNGRYLTPAGFRDTSLAVTQLFRSFFAALFLLTLMCLVVSGIAISVNTMLMPEPKSLQASPWLIALTIPLYFSAAMALSYWILVVQQPKKSLWKAFIVASICYGVVAWLTDFPAYFLKSYLPPVALLIIVIINIELVRTPLKPLSADPGKLRQQLTRGMANSLGLAGIILLLWLVYALGLFWAEARTFSDMVLPPALLILLKAVWEIRGVKKIFSKTKKRSPVIAISLIQTGNIFGYLLLFFSLVTVCAAELQLLVYDSLFHYVFIPLLIGIVIVIFFYLLCQPKHIINLLNLSSLHNFYRSRLERAWLSVANVGMMPNNRFSQNPLDESFKDRLNDIQRVTVPLPDDDVLFSNYAPHSNLGPIHLIGCCINQTVDDRSGNFNADRKGISLTVSSFGAETGTHYPKPSSLLQKSTLSKWIAISGAAAATGMGSMTSPGLAFLLFLIGGRLGFWQRNLQSRAAVNDFLPPLFAEMFARFPGKNTRYWYVSDGGHFENTGVYPLLKRRVKTIVVADCGADPEFIFDDLENLVRKARIDYGISILFSPAITGRRTSLKALKKGKKHLPLIEARIYYPKTQAQKAMLGKLIIVKPHLLHDMGLDTDRYAKRHHDFPQQTTGDQFFDEEQWEAYHQLGLLAGKAVKL